LRSDKQPGDGQDPYILKIKIPFMLSLLANRSFGSFVPGIDDLVYGNEEQGIESAASKIAKGRKAIHDLAIFKQARKDKDIAQAILSLNAFKENQEFMGYGYLDSPEESVPPVAIPYYAFHVMVALGTLFPVLFAAFLYFIFKDSLTKQKWLLPIGLISALLGLFAQQSGWIVAEVGRQPWAINGLLPVKMSATNLSASNVQLTFFMFFGLFTILLIAEITIMLKQISIGPKEDN